MIITSLPTTNVIMAPPNNPGNWHWVDKSVKEWTRDWFGQTLTQIEAEDGDTQVKITKVVRMADDDDHDVMIMQRKTKAIAVFDISLTLAFSATTSDDDDITGEITVADFDHDTKENGFEVCCVDTVTPTDGLYG